jgi:hypothetical protein
MRSRGRDKPTVCTHPGCNIVSRSHRLEVSTPSRGKLINNSRLPAYCHDEAHQQLVSNLESKHSDIHCDTQGPDPGCSVARGKLIHRRSQPSIYDEISSIINSVARTLVKPHRHRFMTPNHLIKANNLYEHDMEAFGYLDALRPFLRVIHRNHYTVWVWMAFESSSTHRTSSGATLSGSWIS